MNRPIISEHWMSPFSNDKDLGRVYNDHCRKVEDPETWIVVKDVDACFFPSVVNPLPLLEEAIKRYPDTGIFTCRTNRVGKLYQCHKEYISPNPDMLHHAAIAKQLADLHGSDCITLNAGLMLSGYFMVFQKKTWERVGGFPELKQALDVDNQFSRRVNVLQPLRIINGLYCYHDYRLAKGKDYRKHLEV